MGMIYIIEADCYPVIYKIGHSKSSPTLRLMNIQAYCPHPLKIVRIFEGGFYEEQAIHEELEGFRLHHEWFKDCPQIREMIEYGWSKKPLAPTVFKAKPQYLDIPKKLKADGWTVQKLLDWAIEQQSSVELKIAVKKKS